MSKSKKPLPLPRHPSPLIRSILREMLAMTEARQDRLFEEVVSEWGPAAEFTRALRGKGYAPSPEQVKPFLVQMEAAILDAGARIESSRLTHYLKLEGVGEGRGHRLYVPLTARGPIESTLDPDLVPGSHPVTDNGRIRMAMPWHPAMVRRAVRLIAHLEL